MPPIRGSAFWIPVTRSDFPEGYEGLAVAFMNMNNEAQSAYYYRRSLTEEDLDSVLERMEEIEFSMEHKNPSFV